MRKFFYLVVIGVAAVVPVSRAIAQQGYEFEVYDNHIKKPGTTEFELNTNFVASGRKELDEGVFPTHHMVRSSLEVGAGITNWLEASVYVLGARRPGGPTDYVGNRIRVTALFPSNWSLPFDVGFTQEVGYARPGFAENRWTYELAPMVGKSWRFISVVANPAFERSLGQQANHSIEFEPRGRISYGFGDDAELSIEYYSSLGPTTRLDPLPGQKHQLFVAGQKELWNRWEVAASVGRGLTSTSDHTVVATRVEYRMGR